MEGRRGQGNHKPKEKGSNFARGHKGLLTKTGEYNYKRENCRFTNIGGVTVLDRRKPFHRKRVGSPTSQNLGKILIRLS